MSLGVRFGMSTVDSRRRRSSKYEHSEESREEETEGGEKEGRGQDRVEGGEEKKLTLR